jgi:hypothetical protein
VGGRVPYPCVKCPPDGKSRPMIRSCGCKSATYTAMFAGEPLYGWTLTPHFSLGSRNAASARSWQSV